MFRYLAITDQQRCPEPLEQRVKTLARLKIPGIQIRDKNQPDNQRLQLTRIAVNHSEHSSILVNSRADIVQLAKADGVHRPESGLPLDELRSLVPRGSSIGASVHDRPTAVRMEQAGIDYLVFGPVAPTPSKPDLNSEDCAGISGLRSVCKTVNVPVLALGGVTPELARKARRAGAYGAAGIGWLMNTNSPEKRWGTMKEALGL